MQEKNTVSPQKKSFKDPITGMEFVWVPGGTFDMGDIWGDGDSSEKPVHKVTVAGFYMGKYPVTQKEYKKIMGENPSFYGAGGIESNCKNRIEKKTLAVVGSLNYHIQGERTGWWDKFQARIFFTIKATLSMFKTRGDRHPVDSVSWNDSKEFITRLNRRSNYQYRLPTEAEWEYAARGGLDDKWSGTNDEACLEDYSFFHKGVTSPVDLRCSNPFGIHDMSGNLWEWCEDRWHKDYNGAPDDGSAWLVGDSSGRVIRGGCCDYSAKEVRSAYRKWHEPADRSSCFGFRLVLRNQPC